MPARQRRSWKDGGRADALRRLQRLQAQPDRQGLEEWRARVSAAEWGSGVGWAPVRLRILHVDLGGNARPESLMNVQAVGAQLAAAKAALCDASSCWACNLVLGALVLVAHLVYTGRNAKKQMVCEGGTCSLK